MKRRKRNYINNPEFHAALLEYRKSCELAEEQGKEVPIIPNYIGQCIKELSKRIGSRGNFSGYPFIEEMIGDGIENGIQAVKSFDPYKYDNPFGYFSQTIWNAFIRRIGKEKKQLYIKYKISAGDNNADIDNDYISEFIKNFEETLEAKAKPKQTKSKGLEAFIEDE